jgi:hypothetical protein
VRRHGETGIASAGELGTGAIGQRSGCRGRTSRVPARRYRVAFQVHVRYIAGLPEVNTRSIQRGCPKARPPHPARTLQRPQPAMTISTIPAMTPASTSQSCRQRQLRTVSATPPRPSDRNSSRWPAGTEPRPAARGRLKTMIKRPGFSSRHLVTRTALAGQAWPRAAGWRYTLSCSRAASQASV